jgi:Flp pilus assembly protein TadB
VAASITRAAEIEHSSAQLELERERIRSDRLEKADDRDAKLRAMREISNRWIGVVGLLGVFSFLIAALKVGQLGAAIGALPPLATVLVTLAVAGGQLRKRKPEHEKRGNEEL